MRAGRLTVVAALLATVVVLSGRAPASADDVPDGGVADLAEEVDAADELVGVSGSEAVEALVSTGTTETVADAADMEADELVAELRSDESLFVTADGLVGYEERMSALDSAALDEPATPSAELTAAEAFALNSRPESRKVLFLDFDGHVTPAGGWNDGASISSEAYASRTSATPAQRAAIHEIWQRVAEDYLPFDINVTTQDPGVEGLRKTSDADQAFGQRMVITPTNWTGDANTLGIALLNVFSSSVDRSAFVFTQRLSPAGIAEAVSHEAGHTFGLEHDGTGTSEYYLGHGPWAPIMGNPIGGTVTQWSRGEYQGANNREDDLLVIATHAGFRSDDWPNTRTFAPLVAATSSTTGIIGAAGDIDMFSVDVGVGPLVVTVQPEVAVGSNLVARVVVRDQAGVVVGMGSPASASGWTSTVSIPAPTPGRYSIEVSAGRLAVALEHRLQCLWLDGRLRGERCCHR